MLTNKGSDFSVKYVYINWGCSKVQGTCWQGESKVLDDNKKKGGEKGKKRKWGEDKINIVSNFFTTLFRL